MEGDEIQTFDGDLQKRGVIWGPREEKLQAADLSSQYKSQTLFEPALRLFGYRIQVSQFRLDSERLRRKG
jgi:hypothetical protein